MDIEGDKIIFVNLSNQSERLAVKVKSLHICRSFSELFEIIQPSLCGFSEKTTINEAVREMREYYTQEDEESGVIGIGIERVSFEETLLEQEQIYENLYDRWFSDGMK